MKSADLWFIVVVTLGCTAAVSLLAAVVLRLVRRASIVWRIAVVVASAIASIACSTLAIAAGMYFTPHDLTVLLWIVSVAAAFSVAGAWLVARGVRRSIASLADSARRMGDGEVVLHGRDAAKEVAATSALLAETSARLAAAREELERLDAARSAFFAWISHDLRTPLTGVRALAEMLEEGMVQDPAEVGGRIRQQADTMSRMVDDLFELSRLQSGTLRPRCEDVVVRDAVSDAVADVRVLAEARGVRIADGDVAGTVWADPYLLGRVLANLLGNAVRHAPPLSVVEVSAVPIGGAVVLGVVDRGPGVPQSDLERMFEVGWLDDPARTPDRGGTVRSGLGLAIVRAILDAHDGTVWAERTADGFRLAASLPARAGSQPVSA